MVDKTGSCRSKKKRRRRRKEKKTKEGKRVEKMQDLKNFGKHARECRQASNARIKKGRKSDRERERRGNVKKWNQRRFNERKLLDKYKNRIGHCNKQTNKQISHSRTCSIISLAKSSLSCVTEIFFSIYLRLFVFTDSRKERRHTYTYTYRLIGHFLLTFSWCLSYIYLYSFILSIKDEYILISHWLTSVYRWSSLFAVKRNLWRKKTMPWRDSQCHPMGNRLLIQSLINMSKRYFIPSFSP